MRAWLPAALRVLCLVLLVGLGHHRACGQPGRDALDHHAAVLQPPAEPSGTMVLPELAVKAQPEAGATAATQGPPADAPLSPWRYRGIAVMHGLVAAAP